jgi:hypothetical protein
VGFTGAQPHLTGHGEIEPLVVGQILLVAAVEHETQADGVIAYGNREDGAEVVERRGAERAAPVGFGDRAFPGVQAPAGIVAGGPLVVDHHDVGIADHLAILAPGPDSFSVWR